MPNRTATFVSAILASFIANAPVTVSYGATPATDTCLASPKTKAPEGSHWFYRIEHPSNRHCWYMRAAQNATSDASVSAGPLSPNAASAMPGSVANARAELTSPQALSDRDASLVTGEVLVVGTVASADNPASGKVRDPTMPRSVVASRWPDQLAANAASAPVTDNSNGNAPSNAVTPPPSAAVAPVTGDAPSEKPSSSIQVLIAAIIGGLSVVGLAASASGFGGRRKNRAGPIESERRTFWETPLTNSALPSPLPAASQPQLGIHRTLHDSDDRVAHMLARLARSARA